MFNHEHFDLLHANDFRSNKRSHFQVLDFPPIKIESAESMHGIVENNEEIVEENEEEEDLIFCYKNSINKKRIQDEENLLH